MVSWYSILDELAKATNDIARGEIIQLELFEKNNLLNLKTAQSQLFENWKAV